MNPSKLRRITASRMKSSDAFVVRVFDDASPVLRQTDNLGPVEKTHTHFVTASPEGQLRVTSYRPCSSD